MCARIYLPTNNAVQSNGFIFLKRNDVWTKKSAKERKRACAHRGKKRPLVDDTGEKNRATGSKKNRQRRMINNTDAEFIFKITAMTTIWLTCN